MNMDEKRSAFKNWNFVYSVVIAVLIIQIILYYLFTITFR